MIVLGIVVAASLVVALLGTVSTTSQGSTPTALLSSQSDPSQLIRAATANPNDSEAVGALADYYNQTGQQQQALTLYQNYVTLRPSDARARVTPGRNAARQRRPRQGRKASSSRRSPSPPPARISRRRRARTSISAMSTRRCSRPARTMR